ncbi:MAG: phage tail protein [Litorilinea sp.]
MADERVFTTFNFLVEITVPNLPGVNGPVCNAAFAECDGLEISIEPKSFHQGGANTQQVHLAGVTSYAQLTLKRGMSHDLGLWRWFREVLQTERRGLRGQATVVMLGIDRTELVTFKLTDCLPVKLRAPALNGKEGMIAIEEMQLVYASLELEFPS